LLFKLISFNGALVAGLGGIADLWVFLARDALVTGFNMDNVAGRPHLWFAIFHIFQIAQSPNWPASQSFRCLRFLPGNVRYFALENSLRQLDRVTSPLY
jgi:hypothetical protein